MREYRVIVDKAVRQNAHSRVHRVSVEAIEDKRHLAQQTLVLEFAELVDYGKFMKNLGGTRLEVCITVASDLCAHFVLARAQLDVYDAISGALASLQQAPQHAISWLAIPVLKENGRQRI